MVKLYCDRCGKEIKKTYYTINFNSYDTNSPNIDLITCGASAYSNLRNGTLTMLNSQKMYCNECKEDIEIFIINDNNYPWY